MRTFKLVALALILSTPLWAGYVSFPPVSSGGGGGGTGWDGASTLATPLTGFSSSAGTVSAGDTILSAFNKVDGNITGVSTFFGGSLIGKEDVANKQNDPGLTANSAIYYPTQQAVKSYADGVSAFATAGLALKENTANKDNDPGLIADSAVLFPTQHAVKSYADGVSTFAAAGLALKEDVANKSTDGTFAANSDTLYPSQRAVKTYADVFGASTLGTANTFAGFNQFGNLDPISGWTVNTANGNSGAAVYNTVTTPVDAGNVTQKFNVFETELASPQDTTQYTAIGMMVDTHHDRALTGNDLASLTGLQLNTEHAGPGYVDGMVGIYSGYQVGTGNGGSVINSTHLDLETSIGAGSSTQNYQGIRAFANIDAGGSLINGTALTLSANGNVVGNWRGMEHIVSGTVGGDVNSIIDNITGDTTGTVTSFSSGISGDAANVTSFNANQQGTYTSSTGMAISMTANPTTNSKQGINVALQDGDADNATILNGSVGAATFTTSLQGANLQFTNAESVNEFGYSISLSSGITKTNSSGYLATAAGTQTNLTGYSFNGTATATNAQGLSLDLSNITSTNRKQGINLSGGGIDASYSYDSATSLAGALFNVNNISPSFTVEAGSPIVAAGPLTPQFGFGNNLGGNFFFEDDYDPDFTGARLGYSFTGMFAGIGGLATKTVDMINLNLAGGSYGVASTGGVITELNLYRALGIVNDGSGGTLTVTDLTGYKVDAVMDSGIGTNKWAFRSDSTTADNWFAKNVVVGGATKQPTNASVGVEVAGTTKALLLSRLTTAQRTALTAVAGMQVYDTDLGAFYCYTTAWAACAGSGSSTFAGGWSTLGNAGLDDTVNFLGTTDGVDLVLRTNNVEAMRVDSATNFVGVSTISPTAELDVNGNARVRYLNTAGVVLNDASGNLSTTPTLSIARGGTNSGAALNNNRVMVSSGSAIVEHSALTADRVLYTDGSGLPAASTITATELSYLSGVTSNIQTQLNSKQAAAVTYSEAPTGTIDGVNVTFTPPHTPTENASIVLTVDGGVVHQEAGADGYTMGGSTITFGTAPAVGQKLWMIYH